MLKVGGENVAALEIESYICTHPAVSIAQVVGVPDAQYIEVPAAFVELRPGTSDDERGADRRSARADRRASRSRATSASSTEWPMSATKIQKFRLREQLISELGLE